MQSTIGSLAIQRPSQRQIVLDLRQPSMNAGKSQKAAGEVVDHWAREMHAIKTRRDQAAFARLFDHYAPRVKGFVMGAGVTAEMAEEITQETFIAIWRKSHLYDPKKATVSSWLFAISRNKKIDLLRRETRPTPDMTDPAAAPDAPPLQDDLLDQNEQAASLYEALETLPEDQRETIRLAFISGRSHTEVAQQLGIPVGTAKSRIRLGVAKLREFLEKKDKDIGA